MKNTQIVHLAQNMPESYISNKKIDGFPTFGTQKSLLLQQAPNFYFFLFLTQARLLGSTFENF